MVPHMLPCRRKAIAVMIGLPPATFSQSCDVTSQAQTEPVVGCPSSTRAR
jgi:hypothetical protein